MGMKSPTNAIIAVTLNCNSHCLMCNLWQNNYQNELKPTDFLKLPSSLKDINITGGEPFLRKDLHKIVGNIKSAYPKARLVINTNGFLPQNIAKQIPIILKIDPRIALRISLDGTEKTHDKIRRTKGGYQKALESLEIARKAGVKDLGISFTIMEDNLNQLNKIYQFTRNKQLELSLTIVSDSPIYFGSNKITLRPKNIDDLSRAIKDIAKFRYKSFKPKEWFRAWFEQKLIEYSKTNKRFFPCDAGTNFFYLDSLGNIYTCHLKNWFLGNLKENNFESIWNSPNANNLHRNVHNCQGCWMICTTKTSMKKYLVDISLQILKQKVKYLWPKN